MSQSNVGASLKKISKTLANSHASREYLLKNTRPVVILCSESIIAVHKDDLKTAKIKAEKALKLIKTLRKKAVGPLQRYLIVPEQELVEAFSLLALVGGKKIPAVESLGVSGDAYILGLLDCIGEIKRLIYDKIRTDKSRQAIKFFEQMENLYLQLYPFVSYDKVVKEVRRKVDVNRILIEETRAALTEEIRRADLIESIKKIKP